MFGRILDDLFGRITDPQVVKLIPEKSCRQYSAMPLFKVRDVLTVAMADPLDVFAIDDLQTIAKCRIEAIMGRRDEINRAIDVFYEGKGALEEAAKGAAQEAEELEIIREIKEEEGSEEEAEIVDAPIIRLVDTIITQAIKGRASDIHVEPDEKNLRIRYRTKDNVGIILIADSVIDCLGCIADIIQGKVFTTAHINKDAFRTSY